ncbi:AAA family ATPase [Rhodococcus erythropolis]|uniref:AAA family ATPase n=1 Tax=Rhodococcus erythropolis TaxID=1833 RepID=UPI00366D536B
MEWHVADFKGIIGCDLSLAPGTTTILTGTNSSGKTSLLQSLLLLRQSGQTDDGIVLNGPLVRLGKASDLVRSGALNNTSKFSIQQESKTFNFEIAASTKRRGASNEDDEADPLSSEMHLTDLRITAGSGKLQPDMHLAQGYISRKDVEQILSRQKGGGNYSILHLKADGVRFPTKKFSRTYLVFNGLRCVEIVKFYTDEVFRELHSKKLRAYVERYIASSIASPDDTIAYTSRHVIRTLHNDLAGYLEEITPTRAPRVRKNIDGRQNNGRYHEEKTISKLLRLNSIEIDNLIKRATEDRCGYPAVSLRVAPWTFISRYPSLAFDDRAGSLEVSLRDTFREVLNEVESFYESCNNLSRRIHYIGPLRDEPRVVWSQWNSETPGLPVGSRGELTANYYAKNRDRTIDFTIPPSGKRGNAIQATLATAVGHWIQYLGIGTQIVSKSFGKIGVGIEVKWNGKRRDLTSLGVGVSQAIPIVIAGLAAPPNAIFIVEQPELHLHPDVQAKLADFFIYSRPDVNYVIETHSEALITRVRRRIAEGELDQSDVNLTFIEPIKAKRGRRLHESGARSRRIEFTTMGDLSEWPDGFISGSLNDTQAIMRATVERLSKGVDL